MISFIQVLKMIYSNKYKFIFYPIPKTATCSLWELLSTEFAAVEYPDNHQKGRHVMILPDGDYSDYLSFTVVRHPFTRARSLWSHCQRLEGIKENFTDFVWDYLVPRKNWLCQTQTEWLQNFKIDYTLKLEWLQIDFNSLPFVQKEIIPFTNKSSYKDNVIEVKSYLGILKWAKDDFQKFDYSQMKF